MTHISDAYAAHPVTSMESGILFPVAVPDGSGGYLIQDNATSWDALQAANPAKLAVLAATTTGVTGTYVNGTNNDGIGATFQLTSTAIPSFDGAEYNTVGTDVSSSLLMKNQGSGAGSAFQNGIWYLSTVADVGVAGAIFTRRSDYNNTSNIIEGSYVNVVSGTQAGLWSMDLGGPIAVGTDPITFAPIFSTLPVTNSVTFAPNGTASGTVFTDWASLCTYVAALNQDQEIIIYFDADSGSITLPSGTFTLPNSVNFKGIGTSVLGSIPVAIFTDETIINGITQFILEDVKIWGANSSSPMITMNASNFLLKMYDAQITVQGGSTQPLISLTNTSELLAYIHGDSAITGISGVETITADSGSAAIAEVNVFDSSQIEVNGMTTTISINANLDAVIDTSYTAATYTGNQHVTSETSGFTLSLPQARQLILCNSASSFLVTVPTNSSVGFPIGTEIDFMQEGAGKVTFANVGGVTIVSAFGNLSIATQYSGATLKKIAVDTWWLFGNLST